MIIRTEERTHPQANPHCFECAGKGYVLEWLSDEDYDPVTLVCNCVLRAQEESRG